MHESRKIDSIGNIMLFRRRRYGRRKFPFRRSFRFRRTGFKRRFKGRRFNAYTGQRGSASALGFRRRRISRRHWKGSLLSVTRHKSHYRSQFFAAVSGATGTTQGNSTPAFQFAIGGSSSPLDFWTATGGLVNYDATITAPLFQDDLILRGGTVMVTCSIPATVVDTIGVRLWWIATVDFPDLLILPSSDQPWGFDPSLVSDFSLVIGKVFHKNEAMLGPDNRVVVFEMKVTPRKVDQFRWLSGGRQLASYIHTVNLTSTTNTAVVVTFSHNLSFSGDANGQPTSTTVTAGSRRRAIARMSPHLEVTPQVVPSTPMTMDSASGTHGRKIKQ